MTLFQCYYCAADNDYCNTDEYDCNADDGDENDNLMEVQDDGNLYLKMLTVTMMTMMTLKEHKISGCGKLRRG